MSPNAFPPLLNARLRRLKRRFFAFLMPLWALTLLGVAGYFLGWAGVFEAAPCLLALSLFVSWGAFTLWRDESNARIVPYFPKDAPRVERETFLSGDALAREWQSIETLARDGGVEPLSSFGLEDENESQNWQWYEAKSALVTIEFLLASGRLPRLVEVDLRKIEAALRDAYRKGVPFRLLLRQSGGVNLAEMDQRKGTF